jgi:hypothetical protein
LRTPPGGKQLEMGDYAGAIESAAPRAGAPDPLTRLAATTNLCVAQTATGAFAAARSSCDRALELARSADGAQHGLRHGTSAAARALSNRGVLRALSGDIAGSARDLRAAALGAGRWGGAAQNLARLESSPSYRVALADGAAE